MPISKLWKNRILSFKEHGNEFTYNEIAEMAGVSRGNVSVTIRKMIEEDPEVVTRLDDSEDGKVRFVFNYAVFDVEETVDEVAPDIPEWMTLDAYFNIMERLGDMDGMEIQWSHLGDWVKQFQRGGVVATVYETGQKIPEYSRTFRVDNCIVVYG
jgi:predicted transcriptional regulator